jgi:hypothetical protein
MNSDLELNRTKDTERRLPCSKCDGETIHRVLVSTNTSETNRYTEETYIGDYEIVQCQGCKTISFRKCLWIPGNVDINDLGEYEGIEDEELYPGRIVGRRKLANSQDLPLKIIIIYGETYMALCNKLPVLTGIGIRTLVEAVCSDKNITGTNLKSKIDSLVSVGLLTKDGAEILHSLRIMGNYAAHEVKPHTEEELNIALDIVEHLLEGVYLLPNKATKLPKR